MLSQIKHLTGIQLCNLFGINELRHTTDKKKKIQFMTIGLSWLLVGSLMMLYIVGLVDSFIAMGLSDIVPVYLFFITSILILFFSFFKVNGVIFQMNTYDMLISLPVSKAAIVISRFMSLYVTNLIVALAVMMTGSVIYGRAIQPPMTFYVYSVLGTCLLPLVPITIATAIGALITGISSRMKHKSLVSSFLSIAVVGIVMVVSMRLSNSMPTITEDAMTNITQVVLEIVEKIYPLAVWYGEATVEGSLVAFLTYTGVAIAIFGLLIAVLQKYFVTICTALKATSSKNNYKMQSLKTNSIVIALCKKEIKRYFASSVYVTNTIIGYIFMPVAAIMLWVMGIDKIEEMMQMQGMVTKLLPIAIGSMAVMMPMTSSSISMEGKQWWIAQTLPVKSKSIFDSKILANLVVVAPFYTIAVMVACLASNQSLIGMMWIVIIPAVYIVFSAVVGITVNLALPLMEWDNEMRVVKQGASTVVTMLVGVTSVAIPGVALFLLKAVSTNLIMMSTLVGLVAMTGVLYRLNSKKDLRGIR